MLFNKPIALDTNFLIELVNRRLLERFFSEYRGAEIYIPLSVVKELTRLSSGVRSARVALEVISLYRDVFRVMEDLDSDSADRDLLRLCEAGYIVATVDRALRRKLLSRGCRVLTIKDTHLFIV